MVCSEHSSAGSAGADCLSVCCLSLLHPSSRLFSHTLTHTYAHARTHSHTQKCLSEQAVLSRRKTNTLLATCRYMGDATNSRLVFEENMFCHGSGVDSVRFCFENNQSTHHYKLSCIVLKFHNKQIFTVCFY